MELHLKKGPKIVLAGLGIVGIIATLRTPAVLAHLPSNFAKAITLDRVQMPAIADAVVANVKPEPYPSASPAAIPATLFRGGIWEWNAQNGLLLANGGKLTKGEKKTINKQQNKESRKIHRKKHNAAKRPDAAPAK